jgi:hypothetical protein
MRKFQTLSFILALVLFAGCSLRPTDEDGRKAVEYKLNLGTSVPIKLISYSKVNGQIGATQNKAGMSVESYSLEFEGIIEPATNCALVPFKQNPEDFWIASGDDDTLASFRRTDNALVMNSGTQYNIYGTVIFEKSEKGWESERVIIKYP